MFFSDVWRAGGKIAYAPDARVTEAVVPERANVRWLVKRRFRYGQTHALVLMQDCGGIKRRVKLFGLAVVKAGVCSLAALVNVGEASRFWYWILRGSLHVGVGVRVLSDFPPNQDIVFSLPVSPAKKAA